MAAPFIFIGTHRLKPGKLDDFSAMWRDLVDVVKTKEPQMIAFNGYANEDGSEVTVVQLHPTPHRWSSICRLSASTSRPPTKNCSRRRRAFRSSVSSARQLGG